MYDEVNVCLFSLRFTSRSGAFLVPYFLMVLVIGLPVFFAELFVGQYSGLGPIKAYAQLAPIFQGKLSSDIRHMNIMSHPNPNTANAM